MAKHEVPQYSLEFLVDDEVTITGSRYEGRTGRIVEDDTDQTLDTSTLTVKLHSVGDLIDPLSVIEMVYLRKVKELS